MLLLHCFRCILTKYLTWLRRIPHFLHRNFLTKITHEYTNVRNLDQDATLLPKMIKDRDRRPGRHLLIGSADVLLLPKASESLAGRMEIFTLNPLLGTFPDSRDAQHDLTALLGSL